MAQWSEADARKKIDAANRAKEQSDDIYREAMELVFPDRENFTKTHEGQQKAQYNWDSQPTVAVIRAANRLSNDFTPSFQPWFEIGLGPAAEQMPEEAFRAMVKRPRAEVKAELEGVTKIVQAVFNGPGFPTASNEVYLDWHFGQGGMQIMPNEDMNAEPVIFASMPMSHFYAYEGPNGKLDRWFFWHEVRADAIKQQWADAKLTEEIEEEAAKANPKPQRLASVVYRDYDHPQKHYRYEVFALKGNGCDRIVERVSRTPPMVTPRHTKLAGENRGRGPVLFAMPDIRTVNKIVELTLRGVAIAVAGVYTATDQGVLSPIAIKPYSIIRVRHNAGSPNGPSLVRLDNPQRVDYGQLVIETLHENIKKIIGDTSLPPEAGPIRTATEFIQRARELIADQAGGLGRLHAEFVIPAVQRVIDILEGKQILPTAGLVIDQFLIEVRMTSPLARGEAMGEVENIIRFIEMLNMIGGPGLLASEINSDRLWPLIADKMEVPMVVRNTDAERKKAQTALAQVATAQAGGDPAAAGAAVDQMPAEQAE